MSGIPVAPSGTGLALQIAGSGIQSGINYKSGTRSSQVDKGQGKQ